MIPNIHKIIIMKEKFPMTAGSILGFAFVIFGANHFLHFIPMPPMPADSPAVKYFIGLGPGYLGLVKVLEIIGGFLVAIPKTRNIGLLIIGPIIVNILAFNLFLMEGFSGLMQPPVILVSVLGAYLLWDARDKFLGLLN